MSAAARPASTGALEGQLRGLAPMLLDALHETLERRDELVIVTKRSAHDLVSDADRTIEALLFDAIRAAFPDDGFLGEEGGWRHGPTAVRDWIVDPIDGTMNFVHGLPWACSAVGVVERGGASAGIVVDPYRDEVYLTVSSAAGSERNGRALAVAPGGELAGGIVLLEVPSGVSPNVLAPLADAVVEAGGSPRTMGSGALAMALVAAGAVQGLVHAGPSVWDVAAGVALVEHAGGSCLGREGLYDLAEPSPLVAGSPETASRLQQVLARCPLPDISARSAW